MEPRRALPPSVRRLADAFLVLTAAAVPLSISGMQIGIAGLGVLAVVSLVGGWSVVRPTPLDRWLALFYGVLLLSTLASGSVTDLVGWSRPWVVVGYYGVFWWLRDRAQARRFAWIVVAAGGVAGLYGILQHWTGADWYRGLLGRPTRTRPRVAGAEGYAVVGFFRNYLTYAHVMVFPLCWATAFALGGAWPAAVIAALIVIAIVFSTARGVWLAVLAGAVILALVVRGGRSLLLLPGLVLAALLVIALSPGLRAQMEPVFTLGGANAGRVEIYRANLDIIHDHPLLGLGFGRYQTAAAPYYDRHPGADRRSHAHSNVLQVAADAGLLGLAAFAILYAAVLLLGWQAVAAAPTAAARATPLGAWLGIVVFLLAGLTQYNFGDAEVAVAMWTATAVLLRWREP